MFLWRSEFVRYSLALQIGLTNTHHGMQKQTSGFTLVEIMIVVMITGLLATLSYPTYQKARQNAWRSTCQSNLRQIQNAVDQYLFEGPAAENVTLPDLNPFFSRGIVPGCPGKGIYSLDVEGGDPVAACDFGFGHEL